jgi:hypothetical protein
MSAIIRTLRNLVAQSLTGDMDPASRHVGAHLARAAGMDSSDPIGVALVTWERLSRRIDAPVEWLDHPQHDTWDLVVDAAKTVLTDAGHLEFAYLPTGAPTVPTRTVYPADVQDDAWIRRQPGTCASGTRWTLGQWEPAFHQVASVRTTYPVGVMADAFDGREPDETDRVFMFLGDDGQPLRGFAYPCCWNTPIEMVA